MKRLSVATVLAMFALAPVVGSACEYDSAASVTPAEKLGLAPAPAATSVPVAKADKAKPARQEVVKAKAAPVRDVKLATASTN